MKNKLKTLGKLTTIKKLAKKVGKMLKWEIKKLYIICQCITTKMYWILLDEANNYHSNYQLALFSFDLCKALLWIIQYTYGA